MVASSLILAISAVLLVYWFRYTCLLLLAQGEEREPANRVAEANRLSFPAVQHELDRGGAELALDTLHSALDRDYRILCYLLAHSAATHGTSVERRVLLIDYRLMHMWYRLVRNASATRARKALREMSEIVTALAGEMAVRAEAEA